ncbi:MAG: hypothetical protein ACOZCL_17540 [Bacillota bacterium]
MIEVKKTLVLILIVITTILSFMVFTTRVNAISNKLDTLMDEIMDNFYENIKKDPGLMASSNPYAYIDNNAAFDAIVELSYEALPYIKDKVEKSKSNGLKEYVYAIAAEKIGKVNLKGENFNWQTGKGWAIEWNKYLKELPANFDKILVSNEPNPNKINKLTKLGTPAIPLIIDAVEKGNTELIPALEALIEGNNDVKLDKEAKKDIKNWIKNNKHKFKVLRELIESPNEETQ